MKFQIILLLFLSSFFSFSQSSELSGKWKIEKSEDIELQKEYQVHGISATWVIQIVFIKDSFSLIEEYYYPGEDLGRYVASEAYGEYTHNGKFHTSKDTLFLVSPVTDGSNAGYNKRFIYSIKKNELAIREYPLGDQMILKKK